MSREVSVMDLEPKVSEACTNKDLWKFFDSTLSLSIGTSPSSRISLHLLLDLYVFSISACGLRLIWPQYPPDMPLTAPRC